MGCSSKIISVTNLLLVPVHMPVIGVHVYMHNNHTGVGKITSLAFSAFRIRDNGANIVTLYADSDFI